MSKIDKIEELQNLLREDADDLLQQQIDNKADLIKQNIQKTERRTSSSGH